MDNNSINNVTKHPSLGEGLGGPTDVTSHPSLREGLGGPAGLPGGLGGLLIDLPKITDPRGNLTFAEAQQMVPFDIKRAYWVYDVPGGESRGGHAHKRLRQFVIALSGSFHVTLDNGHERKTVLLNHPWQGLLIDVNTWRTLDDFSSGAVCLVLASEHYDESDYIYDYEEFLKYVGCSR